MAEVFRFNDTQSKKKKKALFKTERILCMEEIAFAQKFWIWREKNGVTTKAVGARIRCLYIADRGR